MKNCPTCQSDQFKKATLVYAEGHSITVGGAIGVNSGGVGVGVGKGVTRSRVADICAPPSRAPFHPFGDAKLWQAALVLVSLLIALRDGIQVDYFWLLISGVGAAFIIYKAAKTESRISAKHEADLKEYEKAYMCLRCGTLSQPFE